MASILKSSERNFREDPGKIDDFRLFSDVSRIANGIVPENLNFDLRRLDSGQFCAAYHFHRHAEELFMILSGSATLRTPEGLQTVESGDLIFFEKGEKGAHQLYNHTSDPCVYLDIRTFLGHDVCEYPDSNKLFIVPSREIFNKDSTVNYFDGEHGVKAKWEELKNESESK